MNLLIVILSSLEISIETIEIITSIQKSIKNNSQYFHIYLTDSQDPNLQFNRNCTRLCMPIRPFGAHAIDFLFER